MLVSIWPNSWSYYFLIQKLYYCPKQMNNLPNLEQCYYLKYTFRQKCNKCTCTHYICNYLLDLVHITHHVCFMLCTWSPMLDNCGTCLAFMLLMGSWHHTENSEFDSDDHKKLQACLLVAAAFDLTRFFFPVVVVLHEAEELREVCKEERVVRARALAYSSTSCNA